MKKTNPNSIQLFLSRYKKRARLYIGASVFLSYLNCLLMIAGAWIFSLALNDIIFNHVPIGSTVPYLLSIIVIYMIRAGLVFLSDHVAYIGSTRAKSAIRDDLFYGVAHAGMIAQKNEKSGAVLNAYTQGVDALEGYYRHTLPARVTATIIPITIFLIVAYFDQISALILCVTAPLIPVFMIWIGRGAETLNQRQWRRMMYMSGRFLDVIQGLPTLKMFNASKREGDNVRNLNEQFRHDTMDVLKIAFLSSLAMEFFATVSIAMIAVFIGFRLLWGDILFIEGFFILLLAPEFYLPLRKMGSHYHAKMEAIGAAEKIVSIMDIPVDDTKKNDFLPQPVTIEFKNVSYAYDPNAPVLKNINLIIHPGEKVALVGPSGCGKSTILFLLLGLISPQQGDIYINGRPLSQYNIESWHRNLSWMGQRPYLFPGSLIDNIRIGRKDATDSEIIDLLGRCGLNDNIDTILGEGGSGLSGGQIQRVALARAFLRRALLMLLDEPTANLDQETENTIQNVMADVTHGATMIYAAHRPSSVSMASRILEISDGHLLEHVPVENQ